jgi:hypothetical protein
MIAQEGKGNARIKGLRVKAKKDWSRREWTVAWYGDDAAILE